MSKETLRVSEIFGPTIQGEGALIGQPTVFVRLGGCDYRCSWCDTLHAVDSEYRDQWIPMTAREIMEKVEALSNAQPLMISLSGGNPAIQNCVPLIALAHEKGYPCALETQGSIVQGWFKDLDVLTLSPKPPSSHMNTDWDKLTASIEAAQGKPQIALKIVIFDEADYQYAREAAARYPALPLYLEPGNHTPPPADDTDAAIDTAGIMERMHWLVDRAIEDNWHKPTILPQLHVLLWGNKRGV